MSKRSPDHMRGYARGYTAGAKGAWPEHIPPIPPERILSSMMIAGHELRDAVDTQMATFEKDDPMALELYKYVDKFDDAMAALTEWIKTYPPLGDNDSWCGPEPTP